MNVTSECSVKTSDYMDRYTTVKHSDDDDDEGEERKDRKKEKKTTLKGTER